MLKEKVPLKIVVPIIVVTWILSVVSSFAIVLTMPNLLMPHHEHNSGWHVSWRWYAQSGYGWDVEIGTSQFSPTFYQAWPGYVYGSISDGIGFIATMRIKVEREGEYTFTIGSDDGSRLFIDDRVQTLAEWTSIWNTAPGINNWGDHAYQKKSAAIHLTQGFHTLTLWWYDRGGAAAASFECDSPDILTWTET